MPFIPFRRPGRRGLTWVLRMLGPGRQFAEEGVHGGLDGCSAGHRVREAPIAERFQSGPFKREDFLEARPDVLHDAGKVIAFETLATLLSQLPQQISQTGHGRFAVIESAL